MSWIKGLFRVVILHWDGTEKTYWFFDPRSGFKGGLVSSIFIVALIGLVYWIKS